MSKEESLNREPTKTEVAEADQQIKQQMAELKRKLKPLSKNDLIRMYTIMAFDMFEMQGALRSIYEENLELKGKKPVESL